MVDLSGKVFPGFVVLREHKRKEGRPNKEWVCKCNCGQIVIRQITKSRDICYCQKCRPGERTTQIIDLEGKVFGNWKVLGRAKLKSATRQAIWLCKCSCGAEKSVISQHLRSGRSTSCRDCYYKRMRDLKGI